jgi:hypothetical protein
MVVRLMDIECVRYVILPFCSVIYQEGFNTQAVEALVLSSPRSC